MWAVFFRANPFKQTEFFDDEAKARERCDRLQDTGLTPELMVTAWPPPNAPTTAEVLAWAVDMFGPVATNREERAARLLEEALEVAQCEGLDIVTAGNIARRVYSRPRGELTQEIGGVSLTLAALAENAGRDLTTCVEREWARVRSKPREWWTAKHAEKVKDGTANINADSPRVYSGLIRENVWEYGTIEARVASVVDALRQTAEPIYVEKNGEGITTVRMSELVKMTHFEDWVADGKNCFVKSSDGVFVKNPDGSLKVVDACFHGVRHPHECKDCIYETPIAEARAWAESQLKNDALSLADALIPTAGPVLTMIDNDAPGEFCVGITWRRCDHGVPSYSFCPECVWTEPPNC